MHIHYVKCWSYHTQEEYDILSTSVIDAALQASTKPEDYSKQLVELTEQLAVLNQQLAEKDAEYSVQLQEVQQSSKEQLHEFEVTNSQLQRS